MIIPAGSTTPSIDVLVLDDSGLEVTGLTYLTFPTMYYSVGGSVAKTTITLATLAAETTAYSSGGLIERGSGVYRLDLPTGAVTTAGTNPKVFGTASGKRVVAPEIWVAAITNAGELDTNAKRLGATTQTGVNVGLALPAVAPGASGGLGLLDSNLCLQVKVARWLTVAAELSTGNRPGVQLIDYSFNSANCHSSALAVMAQYMLLTSGNGANPIPDVTGYVYDGIFQNGVRRYRGYSDASKFIWWDSATSSWIANANVGSKGGGYHSLTNATPYGTYTAMNGATGTLVVSKLSIDFDAIDSTSISAAAVTKIQNGLATPTNITAGTITTVTNLTNAPTNGDLTGTMKTSVTNAVPTAAVNAAAVWSYLTASATTANSIGKRLVDFVTTLVYATPPTAAQNRAEMDSNSSKLANLDVAVSTRLATGSYVAPTTPPTTSEIATALFVDGATNKLKVNSDHSVDSSVDESAIADAVVAALGDRDITFVSPLSQDGTRFDVMTGDSYSVANGRSLTFSITNQTALIGFIPHIRFEGEDTDFAVAPAISSGTQTIVFDDVPATRTQDLTIGKREYQIRFTNGSEKATAIIGHVTIRKGK